MNFQDFVAQLLSGALDDGEITVNDFEDWKQFKRQARKSLRKLFKRIESESIEVDPADALLIMALMARFR